MQYSNETNKILITLLDGSTIHRDYFETDVWRRLFEDKYIWYVKPGSNHVHLTEAGKAYVESILEVQRDKKTENFRFWLPVIISNTMSLIAIIISIIALLK